MILFVKLFFESFRFAWSALTENPLRTVLSLLGVTIGIFAIVAVLTVVDALDNGIRGSLSFLGNRVVYVEKWPFFGDRDTPWWKIMKRPNPTYQEFKFVEQNVKNAQAVSVYDVRGNLTLRYKSNSFGNAIGMGASFKHNQVADLDIELGRYFSPQEFEKGANICIIGQKVAEELFQGASPLGKEIKVRGLKFRVVGLLKRQGETFLPTPSLDNLCFMPYITFSKIFASRGRGLQPTIAVKGLESDPGLLNLESELRGLMRAHRRLKPKQEDNFAINQSEAIAEVMDGIISALTVAGWLIGSFSLLVGGFGIANIMFVSVKERTNLIGIQKSLGAKNYFILFQFLFEAMFLSFLGGAIGVGLVSLLSFFSTETFIISLSPFRIVLGIAVAGVIGVLSGIIPAVSASRLDPVIAIRSK